jgi:hypothetical protein
MISGVDQDIGSKAMPREIDEKAMMPIEPGLPSVEVIAYKNIRWNLGIHCQIHHRAL